MNTDDTLPPLAPGDQVALRHTHRAGYTLGSGYTLHTIVRVTASGRLVLDGGGTVLNPDLSVRAPRRWGPYHAERVTEKILATVRRDRVLARLRVATWTDLPDETLFAIANLLPSSPDPR